MFNWTPKSTATAPVLTITSPAPNATLTVPFNVAFNYTGPVAYYKLWVDGGAVSTQHSATFSYVVTKLGTGKHVLACQAHDSKLNKTITQNLNITVVATPPPPQPTASISVTPATIPAGGTASLAWSTTNATSVTISSGVGVVAPSGTVPVNPSQTTVYTLTATGPGGTVTAATQLVVMVTPPPIVEGSVSGLSIQTYFPKPILVLAHLMTWFGPGSAHTSARCPIYDSADPIVVANQIGMMKTQGIGGVNIDYYGMKDTSGGVVYNGRACPVVLAECERQGLRFAIQPDPGIMENNKSGIPAQTFFESQIQEVLDLFCVSPAYLKTPDGRFVMALFGTPSGVNMGQVAAKFPTVAFVFEGNGGYGQAGSGGAFAWTPLSGGESFYGVAPGLGQVSIGNLVQGFDDHSPTNPSQSCWGGAARFASYNQGQTFLDSVAAYLAAAHPPTWLQLVTWNDFQEGTNFELGDTSGSVQFGGPPNNGVVVSSTGVVTGGDPKGVDHVEQLADGRWVAVGRPMFLNKFSS